jgi:drug/metabolite transporter (DMT)-like permease
MCSIGLISLTSSHLYRKEPLITSELMSLVSFAPGFVYAVFALSFYPFHLSPGALTALFLKNVLYCFSFYLRYESLRRFGPFVGALMLGTQPIVIFLLAFVLLGETLNMAQVFSVTLVGAALLTLATKRNPSSSSPITFLDFGKYYIFPTLISTLAIVWDRYFLKGQISSGVFFVFDRATLIPAFFLALFMIKPKSFMTNRWSLSPVFVRNWKMLTLISILFTISVYTYNVALGLEKAAVIGLFRNAAYPLAALVGAFLFQQKISSREWLSLSLIASAVFIGAIF